MCPIAEHGDELEKRFWRQFMSCHFASYETFWQREVVPITNRDMRPALFKTDDELKGLDPPKTRLNCYFAQLHYSVMFHLGVAHGIATQDDSEVEYTNLVKGFTALLAATDIAFQLLYWWKDKKSEWEAIRERCEKSATAEKHLFVCLEESAKSFDRKWRECTSNGAKALRLIRDYRDKLVHRDVGLAVLRNGVACFVKVELQDKYGEWGTAVDQDDFAPASGILWPSWKQTVDYIEQKWKEVLIN